DAAVPPWQSATTIDSRDRRPALDRRLVRGVPDGAGGAYGRRGHPGAGDLPPRVSAHLGRQVVRDPGVAPALDAAGQSAGGARGPPSGSADYPAGAAVVGASGGESLLSGGTGPHGGGTGRGRLVPYSA